MAALRENDFDATQLTREHAEFPANRVRDLLHALPVGVFVIDGERTIQTLNPAAADMLGFVEGQAAGRRCADLLGCTYCGPSCAAMQAKDAEETQVGFPAKLTTAGGKKRAFVMDAVPLGQGRVAVLLRDVTDAERFRQALLDKWVFHGLVCVSATTKEIVDRVRDVAPYDSTVLVLGESGTGKELVARAIHAESPRSDRPFVAVNCSAYSENLLESELFGHARGSFTGADRDRQGRFELANGGTVFLDEIGEISPKIQVKLLRVLQEREIERVGENRSRSVDLRIIAATNRDLHREVREGRFREDLFYRLNVYTVQLPPLRERREDIPALVDHFLAKLRDHTGKDVRGLSGDVLDAFLRHTWPGNVRELENVIESALVRARGPMIGIPDLPEGFRAEAVLAAKPEDRIRAALGRTGGCVTRAARLLGIHRTTLWRQMREAGLSRDEFLVG
ncbi:MAG TPA: sigma 54-interacting transcriptional regulator [Planctomycetota bacterium]|nr:sigma 54-interacting transcriptional regulator [Planctomycetota bacterium]